MSIRPFALERYFARYEFKVKYLFSSSDCESLAMSELVEMAAPESRALWDGLKLGYTELQGHPLLRAEVAALYETVPPENVLIAAPEELIFIAMQSMLSKGDHIVAVAPAYQSLHEIADSIGCSVTPWNFHATEAGWTLDLNELEQSLTPETRMIVLNFPHNPTGYMLSRLDQAFIVELARDRGIHVFSDEMYRLLEYDPADRLPPMCDIYEKGISLSGLSKTFSLPGLRLGWLATQDSALLERWIEYHDYTTICNSAPSEILGLIALQNKQRIIDRNLEIIGGNIAAVEQLFGLYPDNFTWYRPRAGSVAFPAWKGPGTVEHFCQDILDRQGVMIVPGSLFGYPGNHFRVGLGRKNLPEGLEQLNEYIQGVSNVGRIISFG